MLEIFDDKQWCFLSAENLKYVLKQIYSDTPESRLNEIEQILNTEQIYSGWDVLVADTNNFREKQIFSEIEILKLEEHIRKCNLVYE